MSDQVAKHGVIILLALIAGLLAYNGYLKRTQGPAVEIVKTKVHDVSRLRQGLGHP
jgi:hypothetical protein